MDAHQHFSGLAFYIFFLIPTYKALLSNAGPCFFGFFDGKSRLLVHMSGCCAGFVSVTKV